MFPGVDGFHWTAGHFIFLGIFFAVLAVIGTTVARALARAWRDQKARRLEAIRWHSEFDDLPARERHCRHEFSGEVECRLCQNGFDCRHCLKHPEFLRKFRPSVEPQACFEMAGVTVPLDRFYHRGHTWVRSESDGTVTVGLDPLAERLLGKPDEVVLPKPGTELEAFGMAWRLRKGGVEARVLAPVDGEVIAAGSPAEGWYLRMKPSRAPLDTTHLLRGAEVRGWMRRELERLHMMAGAEATLPDGGVLAEDLTRTLPAKDWDNLLGGIFLQP